MNLEGININIRDMHFLADKFYNLIILRNRDVKDTMRLFEAKTKIEGCLTIIKSMIYSDNELIDYYNEKLMTDDILNEYFDRMLANLDQEQKDIKDKMWDSKISGRELVTITIKSLKEKLDDYMKHVIEFPLKRTYEIFINIPKENRGKILKIKDMEISIDAKKNFQFLLFTEVLESAKNRGSVSRYKSKSASSLTSATFEGDKKIIRGGRTATPQTIQIPNINDDFKDIQYYQDDF